MWCWLGPAECLALLSVWSCKSCSRMSIILATNNSNSRSAVSTQSREFCIFYRRWTLGSIFYIQRIKTQGFFFMTGKYPALCALEVCGQECLIPCSENTGKKSRRGRAIISQETVSKYPRSMFSLVGSGRTWIQIRTSYLSSSVGLPTSIWLLTISKRMECTNLLFTCYPVPSQSHSTSS